MAKACEKCRRRAQPTILTNGSRHYTRLGSIDHGPSPFRTRSLRSINVFAGRDVNYGMRGSGRLRALVLTLSISLSALCQSAPAPSAETATFEEVSIEPSSGGRRHGSARIGIVATNVTVRQLIRQAYELKDTQIQGPEWIDAERFNITAQPRTPATPSRLQFLLRQILAEHFHLKARQETEKLPVYWLVVADGGPQLRDTAEEHAFNAAHQDSSPFKPGYASIFKAGDLPDFAARLSRPIGRPVIDKTGIAGRFWFQLEWVPDKTPPGRVGPSLQAAIREQLGLSLEEKWESTKVLVIDSIERP